MTIDLSSSEAKRIIYEALRNLNYLRRPQHWLGTREELVASISDWERIASQCEAVIRNAGQWEEEAAWLRRLGLLP